MLKKIIFVLTGVIFFFSFLEKNWASEKKQAYKVYPCPASQSLSPGDKSFITLNVEIPSHSHIYGNPKGPGTGKPTTLKAKDNDNFIFEAACFLPAEKFYGFGEKKFTWVYHQKTKIFLPFRIKSEASLGSHKLELSYESLVCTNSTCLPQNFKFTYPIKVISKGERKILPDNDLKKEFELAKNYSGEKFLNNSKSNLFEEESIPLIEKKFQARLEKESFQPIFWKTSKVTNLWQAILLGLLAGLILNFMPCVLPVVSLKVMEFVKIANKDRKELIILGSLFSAGILVSFLFLAFLAAFLGYNWGNLFQSQIFIVVMASLVFAMALAMFDVYSFNLTFFNKLAGHQTDNQYFEAFLKGLFVTLLATPCSGPFLGGTLSWALTQPPLIIFIIFSSIGFGMAFPYFLLIINPSLTKFIPKPGSWMQTFEQIMGFFLIFTVVYLIAILEKSSLLPMITFLALVGLAFWQYGRWGALHQIKLKRDLSFFMLIIILVGGYFFSFNYLYLTKKPVKLFQQQDFSLEKVYKNKEEGKISMIKFTADWCPNCKLVEKISLETQPIMTIIAKKGIDFMKADITRKFPTAEALLNILGSRSIPFLAILPPGESFYKPICLRDIYSEEDVLEAIKAVTNKD
jgi:thiol:disulfide interchange protein DsbD